MYEGFDVEDGECDIPIIIIMITDAGGDVNDAGGVMVVLLVVMVMLMLVMVMPMMLADDGENRW